MRESKMSDDRSQILYQQKFDVVVIQEEAVGIEDKKDFYEAQRVYYRMQSMAASAGLTMTDLSVFSAKWAAQTPLQGMLLDTSHTVSEAKHITHR
jgi:hypothetical protein